MRICNAQVPVLKVLWGGGVVPYCNIFSMCGVCYVKDSLTSSSSQLDEQQIISEQARQDALWLQHYMSELL